MTDFFYNLYYKTQFVLYCVFFIRYCNLNMSNAILHSTIQYNELIHMSLGEILNILELRKHELALNALYRHY